MFIIEVLSPLGVINITREATFTIQGKEESKVILAIFPDRLLAQTYIDKNRENWKNEGVCGYRIKEFQNLSNIILN